MASLDDEIEEMRQEIKELESDLEKVGVTIAASLIDHDSAVATVPISTK